MTDLNKVDQTTNEFIIKKPVLTNLPTKFTEINDTNLLNVTILKKVDQSTNDFSINKDNATNILSKFTENNDTN